MFHYITLFISDNKHQSKVKIGKFNPGFGNGVRIVIANLKLSEKLQHMNILNHMRQINIKRQTN